MRGKLSGEMKNKKQKCCPQTCILFSLAFSLLSFSPLFFSLRCDNKTWPNYEIFHHHYLEVLIVVIDI